MRFHDLQFDLARERIGGLRREAEHHRLVREARRARARRRRLDLWRRAIAPRLAATVQAVSDVVSAITGPAWPTRDTPSLPRAHQSPGR